MRIPIGLRHAYRLINHGPAVLIGSAHQGRANVMAAAWLAPLEVDPPKIMAVIGRDSLTHDLVTASGEFTVNVPTVALCDRVFAAGSVSGRDLDKFEAFGLVGAKAFKVGAPLVEGCVGWLEARLLAEPEVRSRYDLFLAEVVYAWADDAVFESGAWRFPDPSSRTIHHLSGRAFVATGERLEAADLNAKRG